MRSYCTSTVYGFPKLEALALPSWRLQQYQVGGSINLENMAILCTKF